MDKREKAEIILQAISDYGPVAINWNFEGMWLDAIIKGLKKAEIAETLRAATPRGSK